MPVQEEKAHLKAKERQGDQIPKAGKRMRWRECKLRASQRTWDTFVKGIHPRELACPLASKKKKKLLRVARGHFDIEIAGMGVSVTKQY